MGLTASYDSKCLSTAEYFLGTIREKGEEESLAQAIQSAVEDWFSERNSRNEAEPSKPPLEAPVNSAILHCPFCDSEAIRRETIEHYTDPVGSFACRHSVACDECGIEIGEEHSEDAIAAWNRRATPQRTGQ